MFFGVLVPDFIVPASRARAQGLVQVGNERCKVAPCTLAPRIDHTRGESPMQSQCTTITSVLAQTDPLFPFGLLELARKSCGKCGQGKDEQGRQNG